MAPTPKPVYGPSVGEPVLVGYEVPSYRFSDRKTPMYPNDVPVYGDSYGQPGIVGHYTCVSTFYTLADYELKMASVTSASTTEEQDEEEIRRLLDISPEDW